MIIPDEEEKKLLSVRSFIENEIESLSLRRTQELTQARESGSDFAYGNPYGAVYLGQEVFELQEKIGGHMDESNRCLNDIKVLTNMLSKPYFGRVDFKETGSPEEKIYIGIRTLSSNDNYDILVYDWRAPVCSLFYLGETGKASYTAPCGEISGEITKIRQYKFVSGKLAVFWDADLKVDDSVLNEVLSEPSSDKLKVIVSSIQREQNSAIRYSPKKNLAVFGPAGCGKTSVGMHRLAFLLYDNKEHLTGKNMLLFTSSNVFLSYVRGILPELGEDDVMSTNFGELFEQLLPGMKISDYTELAGSILKKNALRTESVRLKYSQEFTDFIDRNFMRSDYKFTDIAVYGKTIITGEGLLQKYLAFQGNQTVKSKLTLLSSYACDEISHYFLLHRVEIIKSITENSDIYLSSQKLFETLLVNTQNSAKSKIMSALPSDFISLYVRLYESFGADARSVNELRKRISKNCLCFEDAAVILYMAAVSGRFEPEYRPQHILLDEAQDLSPIQHKTLRLLYPKTVFTVLADVNQAIIPEINTLSAEDIARNYGCEIIRLNKSYRSTLQINRLAFRYLDGDKYELFDREGREPQFISTENKADTILGIINGTDEKYNSICIITRTANESESIYARIKEKTDCTLIISPGKAITGRRVMIMPVTLTKGLEFDCVIIPFPEELSEDRRSAYMMITRALHEIYLLGSAPNGA